MKKMEIIEEKKEQLHYALKVNEEVEVRIGITFLEVKWVWILAASVRENWNYFILNDKKFIPIDDEEPFSKEHLKQINEGFYELIKQMKQNQKSRFKIINAINDKSRKIWSLI